MLSAVSRKDAKTNYYLREGHVSHRLCGVLEQTAVQPPNPEKGKKERKIRVVKYQLQEAGTLLFFLVF